MDQNERNRQFVVDTMAGNAWRMFRIIGEFADGFESLSGLGTAVTVFGSARSSLDTEVYRKAEILGEALAKAGYAVCQWTGKMSWVTCLYGTGKMSPLLRRRSS